MGRSSYNYLFITSLVIAISCTIVGCGRAGSNILKAAITNATVRNVSSSSADEVRNMFEVANAQCPHRVDAFTTLERIEVIDDRNVEYHYRVTKQGSKLVKKLNAVTLQKIAIKQMKGNPVAVAIAEEGLTIRHIYLDQSGIRLFSYVIDKSVIEGNSEEAGISESNDFGDTESELSGNDSSNADTGNVVEQDDWLPTDLTPSKKDEEQPWRIQDNPFFEA